VTPAPDIVGIGALNLDLVVGAGLAARWERGIEHRVDDRTMAGLVEAARRAGPRCTLGGSAFTTVCAIAAAGTGLRLGFVGVAGRVPAAGLSALDRLDQLGIDRRFVARADQHLCGVCVAVVEGGDRTLLTHGGANGYLADHLDGVLPYLARSRIVHLTSFLDERSAGRILGLLGEVRRVNPGVVITFDPGHVWSAAPSPEIEGILRLSDYLLVNEREWAGLSGVRRDDRTTVVVKRPDGIEVLGGPFVRQRPLPEHEIRDPTGAGDVFAAGFLIGLARDLDGVTLGLGMVRRKLRGDASDTGRGGPA
jgi:sugar/nucleoside kinase (ribokinase family)